MRAPCDATLSFLQSNIPQPLTLSVCSLSPLFLELRAHSTVFFTLLSVSACSLSTPHWELYRRGSHPLHNLVSASANCRTGRL